MASFSAQVRAMSRSLKNRMEEIPFDAGTLDGDIRMLQVNREELEADIKARENLDNENKAVMEHHVRVFRKHLEALVYYVEKWFKPGRSARALAKIYSHLEDILKEAEVLDTYS